MTHISDQVKPSLEEVLAHHGIKGMKWGVRKADPSSGGSSGKPQKLTRAQRKAEEQKFYQDKARRIMETASQDPQSLIALKTPYGKTIVTGQELVVHMSRGGLMDVRMTDVYAQQHNGKGPYIINPNFNAPYVRSDKLQR